MNCKDNNGKLYGQSRRNNQIRYDEHLALIKYDRMEQSNVTHHVFNSGHSVVKSSLKIVGPERDKRLLDTYESLDEIEWASWMAGVQFLSGAYTVY